MIQKNIRSLSVYQFENLLSYPGLLHFVSSRKGGVSKAPYSSLNLAFHVGDDPQSVIINRQILTSALEIPMTSITSAKQIHCDTVKVVTKDLTGRGAYDYESALNDTDALITDITGVCLCIFVADCAPIVVFDHVKKVVGVVHAGWKGTINHIAHRLVLKLQQEYNCSPKDIVVGIGPSIGPCCYYVNAEVIDEIKSVFGNKTSYVSNISSSGKGTFDLWMSNYDQLVHAGIPKDNIQVAGICTYDNVELFFSERHQKGRTGRCVAGVMLVE